MCGAKLSKSHIIAANRQKYVQFCVFIHLLGCLNPDSNEWKIKKKMNGKKLNKRNEEERMTLHTTTPAREGQEMSTRQLIKLFSFFLPFRFIRNGTKYKIIVNRLFRMTHAIFGWFGTTHDDWEKSSEMHVCERVCLCVCVLWFKETLRREVDVRA